MKPTSWNLMMISESLQKMRISFAAVLIIAAAFVLAFCTTVFLLLMFPQEQVHETDRSRLVAENHVVRPENKNLTLKSANLFQK